MAPPLLRKSYRSGGQYILNWNVGPYNLIRLPRAISASDKPDPKMKDDVHDTKACDQTSPFSKVRYALGCGRLNPLTNLGDHVPRHGGVRGRPRIGQAAHFA